MTRRKVRRISASIATLERRLQYLEGRIDRQASGKDLSFDRREVDSLRNAIRALRMAELLQNPATDPLLLLEDVLNALEACGPLEVLGAEHASRLNELIGRSTALIGMAQAALDGDEEEAA